MTGFADQGIMVDAIYLDCSKAFNTVRKYSKHTSLDVTDSSLDGQAQNVVNTLYCMWRPVTNGVP